MGRHPRHGRWLAPSISMVLSAVSRNGAMLDSSPVWLPHMSPSKQAIIKKECQRLGLPVPALICAAEISRSIGVNDTPSPRKKM